MEVIRAGVLGFCMGVRRAVNMAVQLTACERQDEQNNRHIYTLGPLIHNQAVLEDLNKQGIRILDENEALERPEDSTVIIRAHGVPPLVEEKLARLGARILDATCPHVKASQNKARSFAERGYRIFLAGEKNHGEIAGIRGYAEAAGLPTGLHEGSIPDGDSRCYVVGSPEEAELSAAELYQKNPGAKTALIGQTTIMSGEYRAIGERIRHFFPDLETVNTICGGTADRQDALRELCSRVDAVIVAGSRESANTRRLLSLAAELGKPAWLTETPADLPSEIGNFKTVGLSAGASTPDSLIDGIEKALKHLAAVKQ